MSRYCTLYLLSEHLVTYEERETLRKRAWMTAWPPYRPSNRLDNTKRTNAAPSSQWLCPERKGTVTPSVGSSDMIAKAKAMRNTTRVGALSCITFPLIGDLLSFAGCLIIGSVGRETAAALQEKSLLIVMAVQDILDGYAKYWPLLKKVSRSHSHPRY